MARQTSVDSSDVFRGVKILCGIWNVEFDHVYFAELQVRNVRLSVGSRELL